MTRTRSNNPLHVVPQKPFYGASPSGRADLALWLMLGREPAGSMSAGGAASKQVRIVGPDPRKPSLQDHRHRLQKEPREMTQLRKMFGGYLMVVPAFLAVPNVEAAGGTDPRRVRAHPRPHRCGRRASSLRPSAARSADLFTSVSQLDLVPTGVEVDSRHSALHHHLPYRKGHNQMIQQLFGVRLAMMLQSLRTSAPEPQARRGPDPRRVRPHPGAHRSRRRGRRRDARQHDQGHLHATSTRRSSLDEAAREACEGWLPGLKVPDNHPSAIRAVVEPISRELRRSS